MTAYSPFPVFPSPRERPKPRNANQILHLLLTIVSGGLWAVVWLLVALETARLNRNDTDEYERKLAEHNRWIEYARYCGQPAPPAPVEGWSR
jgi:hypothetical protein